MVRCRYDSEARPRVPAEHHRPLNGPFLAFPLAGVACGLFSCLYNWCLVSLTNGADRTGIKQPWRLSIAFLASFALVYIFPDVMTGLGPGIPIAHGTLPIKTILLLWAVKICFNWFSFASGVSGGILMPMLLAGGLTGALLSCLIGYADPAQSHTTLLVILCMAGLFSGTVRAPLTGAFLITEMTGAWLLLPAVLCTSVIASLLANLLGSAPVYNSCATASCAISARPIPAGNHHLKT